MCWVTDVRMRISAYQHERLSLRAGSHIPFRVEWCSLWRKWFSKRTFVRAKDDRSRGEDNCLLNFFNVAMARFSFLFLSLSFILMLTLMLMLTLILILTLVLTLIFNHKKHSPLILSCGLFLFFFSPIFLETAMTN